MYKGRFITFFEHKQIVSCLCLDEKQDHLVLLCGKQNKRKLKARRVLHCSQAQSDPGLPDEHLCARLQSYRSRQHDLKCRVDSAALWDQLRERGSSFSFSEIAEAAFGTVPADEHETAALYALAEDRIFFKLKGTEFVPNPPEKVSQLKKQREQEYRAGQKNAQCFLWLGSVVRGAEIPCPVRDTCVDFLKSFCVHGTDDPRFSRFRTVLRDTGLLDPRRCFELLVKLGVWDRDENLSVYRHAIARTWPDSALRESQHIAAHPGSRAPDMPGRADLTGLQTFTIDDEQTKDIDDALSFEETGGFVRVGVHITDASSFIAPGSALDTEAARRATSVYFPEGKIPMLPQLLSENLLSLRSKKARRAISFFATLTPEGVLVDHTVQRSVISVSHNLTYRDADRLITGKDTALTRLYALARHLRENRSASGACSIQMVEPQVTVDNSRNIHIRLRDKELPSQVLVSECMILANYCAASLLRNNRVPALFRKQRQAGGIPGPCGDLPYHELVKLRKQFMPVEVGTAPGAHDILGLQHYVTVTSPMRKYLDLITQRQIAAFLSGSQRLYSNQELEEINAAVQPVLFHASRAQAERRRYWILKHILLRGNPFLQAIVLDVKFRTCSVALQDYCIHAGVTLPPGLNVTAGECIAVKVKQVDPFSGLLKLDAAEQHCAGTGCIKKAVR